MSSVCRCCVNIVKETIKYYFQRRTFLLGALNIYFCFSKSRLIQRKRSISLKFCLFNFIFRLFFIFPCFSILVGFPFGGAILVEACHRGSKEGGSNRPRPLVNLNPFQVDEFYPRMSEQTIGASGPAEGPIYRDTERYQNELTPNFNPDIVFRDEEGTNEDRMMTQRCLDRLNVLAILVLNQWPDVRLRVTEAWDDPEVEGTHEEDSLHYEGRAVDVTTSDRDLKKYPLLARMAVEAGFDWVLLKPTYVHCSVQLENSPASINGGCFSGESLIPTPAGSFKKLQDLRSGEEVLSVDSSAKIVRDRILTFMDVQRDKIKSKSRKRLFVSIKTELGVTLQLTPRHLIYKQDGEFTEKNITNSNSFQSATVSFATNIRVGDFIFVADFSKNSSAALRLTKVIQKQRTLLTSGAFAPLTEQGNIIVDGGVASCYAVLESHTMAHVAMAPLRYYHKLRNSINILTNPYLKDNYNKSENFKSERNYSEQENGVSLYAQIIFKIVMKFLPYSMLSTTLTVG